MHHRYFIQLAYKGTNYNGWQIQPNGKTIQEELSHALSTLLKVNTEVTGAGRTDTGVHARKLVAHFDAADADLHKTNTPVFRLNGILPKDIVVNNIRAVKPDAHARFSALSRTYTYHIHQKKDPFLEEFSAFYPGKLDIEKLNRGAELLLDYTDFTSFSKVHTDVKTNDCKIFSAEWIQEDYRYTFTIRADRFLRNMVRAIVGTLVDAGLDKICLAEVRRIIDLKDRSAAGTSAPANGLFLIDVEYPEAVFL
jgi:tRNA pseudouridine38-40 synthase